MKKQILTKTISHIFNVLLSVTLTYVLIVSTLALTVMNTSFTNRMLEKTGYAQNLHADIVTKLKTLSAASGVDESFFETAVNAEYVRTDAHGFVSAALSGQSISQYRKDVTEAFEPMIYQKLETYAKDNGFELTDSVKDSLSHLASVSAKYYANLTAGTIIGTVFTALGQVSAKLLTPMLIGAAVLLIVCIIAFINALRFGMDNIVKSLIGAGLAILVIPIAVLVTDLGSRLAISGMGLTALVGGILGTLMLTLTIEAIILFAIAALFSIIHKKQA